MVLADQMDPDNDNVPTVPSPGITKKQELNNHIVIMRKCVRQAKVHVINKLTKEITKLRSRKGAEEVRQKCQRKAERLVKDVLGVKELELDKVSESALQSEYSLDDVLRDVDATHEDRARIRLIHHPAVQAQVKKYRDANPHWKLQIPVLLEKSSQKLKLRQKKLAEKERLKLERKQLNKKSEEEVSIQNSEAETDDSGDSEHIPESVPKKKIGTKRASAKVGSKEKSTNSVQTPSVDADPEILSKFNKVQGTVKVQVIKDWSELDADIPVLPEVSKTPDTVLKTVPKSSFFLGGTNEDEDGDEKTKVTTEKKVTKTFTERKPAPQRASRVQARNSNAWSNKADWNNKNLKWKMPQAETEDSPPVKKHMKEVEVKQPKQSAPLSTGEKLHPSWEAKKRQNQAILPFKGKKITFDD